MALLRRFSRLLQADLHGLLEALEEPEALLQQALREMEEALSEDENRLQESERSMTELRRRHEKLNSRISQAADELSVALTAANDELARAVVKRKLSDSKTASFFFDRLRMQEDTTARLRVQIAERRAAIDRLREKAALFQSIPRKESGAETCAPEPTSDEIECEFLRAKVEFTRSKEGQNV